MINWNTIPMTYNDSWTYLEMLGKIMYVLEQQDSAISNMQTAIDVINGALDGISEAISARYTKTEVDALLTPITAAIESLNHAVDDVYTKSQVYTKTECDERFAPIQETR